MPISLLHEAELYFPQSVLNASDSLSNLPPRHTAPAGRPHSGLASLLLPPACVSIPFAAQKRRPGRVSAAYLQHGDDGAQGLDELAPGRRRHPHSALQQVQQDGLGRSAHLPNNTGAAATSSHVPVTLHARSGKLLQSVPLPPEVLFPQHHLTFCSQPVFPPLMVSLFIFKVHFSIEQKCSLWKYSYYNYYIIPTPYMKNLQFDLNSLRTRIPCILSLIFFFNIFLTTI